MELRRGREERGPPCDDAGGRTQGGRERSGDAAGLAALVSANSLGAGALGMGDHIGSITPGLQADIIALDGDPLTRHHRRPPRRLRHESRRRLQARRPRRHSRFRGRPALITLRGCAEPSYETKSSPRLHHPLMLWPGDETRGWRVVPPHQGLSNVGGSSENRLPTREHKLERPPAGFRG
jgi:Amidohydrolase family